MMTMISIRRLSGQSFLSACIDRFFWLIESVMVQFIYCLMSC